MKKNSLDEKILPVINNFIDKYGNNGLLDAIHTYEQAHQIYLFQSKSYTKQIPIESIHYVEIFGHNVLIHTDEGTLAKYGTLKEEHNRLKSNGFVRCSQSFLIPLDHILEIQNNHVLLSTGERFRLSRSCATDVICEYTRRHQKKL